MPTKELTRGSTLAERYEIIEELGKGGMGRVYRVVDKKIDEEVALKILNPEISADKKTIQRFQNELKLARKIAHRNVCHMYHLGEEEGTSYITMEYVPGEDLKSFIRRIGQLPGGKSISIAKQVCDGLAEAHRLGVIHRDLKPQNIMIDKEGNARIMDFGIARSLKGKGITGAGVMIGTPEYMSPEQVEGKDVDQRSDIYSLGVNLYEMITGQVPFEGNTPFTIGMKHKSEIPKDPKEFNAQIPEDLSKVILKCLEKDKDNRYQSADALRSELINIEKGLPTSDRILPQKKPLTSKEITVTFGLKKFLIPTSIAAALIVLLLFILSPWSKKEPASVSLQKPSIAVLPFDDISLQQDQESFCAGLSNSIINALSNLNDLTVRARGSSFSFKDKGLIPQEIGKRLNVDTILEGTLQKEGNRLRLTAQLINVSDASLLWGDQWDRELAHIFDIQDEITDAIVKNLKIELLGEEEAKLKKRATENIQALNLYSTGLFYWNRRTTDGLEKAIDYFEKAIEEDPNYALAYVGLADCYNLLHFYSGVSTEKSYPKAKEAAKKALEIDETLGEAHNSLGYYKARYEWDLEGAEKEYKRAIELNPNYATAHFWYGELLQLAEKYDDAVEEVKIAVDLDPISLIINSGLGFAYGNAGKYDQAIAQLSKTLEMDSSFAQAHLILGIVYSQMKNYPDAISEFFQAKELSGKNAISLAYLGYAYGRAEKYEEANKILQELREASNEQYVAPYWMAIINVGLGKNEEALDFLEKAYEERNEFFVFLNSKNLSFFLAPLFPRPRYKELLKKIGFRK
ncbi:MAG: protein kinase [Candidatus Aminicenantes bacterium]|nr:protein kinase [Candidatus Aminicenantes bacterium]